MEHDLIAAYDDYELEFTPVPKPEADSARRIPPPRHAPPSRRRNHGH
ncbi:hypothetical protein QBA74_42490 [Streptomyces scabiei]